MPMIPAIPDVGVRTRRRIAWRLLPFVFLLYLVAYLDRANVSFAALKMNLDLGFSDRIYGLGVAMFFLGYVLFEVPGAIIVERWSARKWRMCIAIPPKYPVAFVIGFLKGKSAIAMARLCGKERNFTGEHFWARGYAVSTVGFELEQVRKYIREQEAADGNSGSF